VLGIKSALHFCAGLFQRGEYLLGTSEMPDESRNLRIVHNRLSSHELSGILNLRGWSERKLAELSGIFPSDVSAHLSGKRVIRLHHLAAYLRVLDRQERAMFLGAWLRDNLDQELVADLLGATNTDSMPTLEENQRRMLDWWATALAGNFKLARIFSHLTTKADFKFPSLLLLPVGTAFAQFGSWLLEKASSVWYLVRSLCSRVEHAAVGLAALILALCQQGKVPEPAGQLAQEASSMAERAITTAVVATSFAGPALAETTNFDASTQRPLLPSAPEIGKGKVGSRANVKRSPTRAQPQHQNDSTLRVGRTITHEWHRLVALPKGVHSAFARLLDEAHPQQSKQKHRNQQQN
jgi:transcriptional regulator with XRE-family HTH domain